MTEREVGRSGGAANCVCLSDGWTVVKLRDDGLGGGVVSREVVRVCGVLKVLFLSFFVGSHGGGPEAHGGGGGG